MLQSGINILPSGFSFFYGMGLRHMLPAATADAFFHGHDLRHMLAAATADNSEEDG